MINTIIRLIRQQRQHQGCQNLVMIKKKIHKYLSVNNLPIPEVVKVLFINGFLMKKQKIVKLSFMEVVKEMKTVSTVNLNVVTNVLTIMVGNYKYKCKK